MDVTYNLEKSRQVSLYSFLTGIFFLVAVGIFYINFNAINHIHYEIHDFASNSLLIQDAKKFRLLTGNYSRVGFYHPGPAILYVLAFGEVFFYDVLHLVPSPFSGQIMMLPLYWAFWMTWIAYLIYGFTRSLRQTLLSSIVFIGMVAFSDHEFFVNIWFPYLYFLPFAVFLLATAHIAAGFASFIPLALSLGFLIHGHVCFIPLCSLILFMMFGYHYFAYRKQNPSRFILRASFFRDNKKQILLASFLFSLFLFPIFLRTFLEFPEPFASYIAFPGKHESHPLWYAINFICFYWRGVASMFLCSMLALICSQFFTHLLGKSHFSENFFLKNFNGILLTLLSSSIATIIYAKYGVDHLEARYIGIFYYSVPGLFISFLSIYFYIFLTLKKGKYVALTLIYFLGLAFLFSDKYSPAVSAETPEEFHYSAAVPHLFARLNEKYNGRRIIVEMNNQTGDWSALWKTMVAVGAYAKRSNKNIFCIHRSWSVVFTPYLKCTPEEIRSASEHKHYFVSRLKNSSYPLDMHEGDYYFYNYSS